MSKKKGKFTFFIAAALVIGYAIYDYVHEQNQEVMKKNESLLYSGPEEQIQRVEIKTDKTIVLEKTSNGWQVKSPLEDQGDQNLISQFISGIVTERSLTEIDGLSGGDKNIYGLKPPKGEIVLTNNLGESQRFIISSKKNFEGNVYLEKGSSPHIFVVSSTWMQKIERKVDDFRDKRWARIEPVGVESVSLQIGAREVNLTQKDQVWVSAAHSEWRLDQNKVRKIVSDFSANQFQKMDVKLETKPLVHVSLKFKDGKAWSAQIGINSDKHHVLSVDGSSLSGEIIADEANEILRLDLDSLRDRNEPFSVKRDLIKKVNFESPETKFTVLEKQGHWILGPGNWGDKYLDEEAFRTMLGKVISLNVKQFVEGKSVSAGSPNLSTLIFVGENEKVLLSLRWASDKGSDVNAGVKSSSSLVPFSFTLDLEKIKELGLSEILKAKQGEKK